MSLETTSHRDPILITDPLVLAVPVEECGEPLVDLLAGPLRCALAHPRASSREPSRFHCRSGVEERLRAAEAALGGRAHLLIAEAHRPLHLQERYWHEDRATFRAAHPDWDDERLDYETARFVSPPWIVPPHSTGGAIDLLLVDRDGHELDMGWPLNTEGPLMRTAAGGIDAAARANRDLMLEAMAGAGFVNYDHEWWHFSYGDRYWAHARGVPAARYGSVELP